MKNCLPVLFLFLCTVAACCTLHAQNSISGVVQDSLGHPLSEINVLLKDGEKAGPLNYTITNKQGYFTFPVPKGNNLFLVFSNINYEKEIVKLSSISEKKWSKLVVVMREEIFDLSEVVVSGSRKPMLIKNDTIVYRTKYFTDGTEITVENLLTKLPGVDVEGDGTVKVGGKEVDRIMVEGDDLFEKGYKTLSKNMPAYPVEEVEILQHYVHNKLLKKVSDSEKVALNLKLSKEAKNVWFGNIRAGLGSRKSYDLQTNLMRFSKQNKSYLLSKFNNIGILLTEESREWTDMDEDVPDVVGEQRVNKLQSMSSSARDVGDNRSVMNRSRIISMNNIFKLGEQTSIKANALLGEDDRDFTHKATDHVKTEQLSYTNHLEEQMNKNKKMTLGKLDVTHAPSDDEKLEAKTTFYKNDLNDASQQIFNDLSSEEQLLTEQTYFEQSLFYTNRLKDKTILFGTAKFCHEKVPESYHIDRFYFDELFPKQEGINNVLQTVSNKMNVFDAKLCLLQRQKQSMWLLQAGYNDRHDLLDSQLSLAKDEQKPYRPEQNINQLDYRIKDLYLLGSFKQTFGRFNLFSSVALHRYALSFKTDSRSENKGLWVANPSAGFMWAINKTNKVTASYSFTKSQANISDLYNRDVMTGFRSFSRGYGKPISLNSSTYLLIYNWGSFEKDLQFFLLGMYIKQHDAFSSDWRLSRNTLQTKRIITHGNDMLNVNGNLDYYVRSIRSNIKLKSSYSSSTSQNILNQSDLRKIRSNNLSLGAEIRSGFMSGFNYGAGVKWDKSWTSVEGLKHDFHKLSSFFDLSYQFGRRFNSKLKFDYHQFSKIVSDKSYSFLDIELNYQLIPQKLKVYMNGDNLLNMNEYTTVNISDIGTYTSSSGLRPRCLIVGFEFRF